MDCNIFNFARSQIDYYDEETSDNEYENDGEVHSLSGEEDEDLASEPVDGEAVDGCGADDAEKSDEIVSESSLRDNRGDYSDGWLLSEDEQQNVDEYWKSPDDQPSEPAKIDLGMNKDPQSQDQHEPDVKISAITGVGLQELLQIIDERLKILDNKQKVKNVVEKDIFNRKWRPPHSEDSSIAFEQ